MAIDTKPNLSDSKFEQLSGETLSLHGCTDVFGVFSIRPAGIIDSHSGYKISGVTIFDTGDANISAIQIGVSNYSNAERSTIIGGSGNTINELNTGASIIGGNAITLTDSLYVDHTIVPNLAIWCTPNGSGNLLGWNSTTKKVELATGISGATNGLSVTDNVVSLGGNLLTGRTSINIDAGELYITGGTVFGLILDSTTAILGDGLHQMYIDSYVSHMYQDDGSLYSISAVNSDRVCLLSKNCIGDEGTEFILTPSAVTLCSSHTNFAGIQYFHDYSGNFTARSLVDAEYVTGLTSSVAADNGLINNSGVITLGGALTGDTLINLNSNYFQLCNDGDEDNYFMVHPLGVTSLFCNNDAEIFHCLESVSGCVCSSSIYITPGSFQLNTTLPYGGFSSALNLNTDTGCTSVSLQSWDTNNTIYNTFEVQTSGIIVCGNILNFSGITYCTDFSENFTARSLVDKGYVDVLVASSAVTACNGLTNNGGVITLGGQLTGATAIDVNGFSFCVIGAPGELPFFEMDDTVPTGSTIVVGGRGCASLCSCGGVKINALTNLNIGFNGAAIITDDTPTTPLGLQYAGDYSANFTARSLVDAAYVTGLTSSITGERITKNINQTSHGFIVGDVIGWDAGVSAYSKSIADGTYNGEVLGIVSKYVDVDNFDLTQAGYVTGLTSLSAGDTYFLSDSVAGLLTTTEPTTDGYISKAVLVADTETSAWVLPYAGYVVTTGSTGGSGAAANGLNLNGDSVELGGALCKNTVITGLDTFGLSFSGGTLQYTDDYSSCITARSIPDAAWVTGITNNIVYNLNSPATCTVGGVTPGYVLTGKTIMCIIQDAFAPYITPTFSAFDISAFTSPIEVGAAVSGTKTFTWATTTSANVCANTIGICEVGGALLGSGLANDGSEALSTGTKINTSPTTWTWQVTGMTTQSAVFSRNVSKCSVYPVYYGKVSCVSRPNVDNTLITGGTKTVINSTSTVTVTFASTNQWTWVAIPATSTSKTCWYVNNLDNGRINNAPSDKYPDECVLPITTTCWSGINYKVYMSGFAATDASAIQFRNS